jgi:hypothetical protein
MRDQRSCSASTACATARGCSATRRASCARAADARRPAHFAVTTTLTDPLRPPIVAVTKAVPARAARTFPLPIMDATAAFDVDQTADPSPPTGLPAASTAVAVSFA